MCGNERLLVNKKISWAAIPRPKPRGPVADSTSLGAVFSACEQAGPLVANSKPVHVDESALPVAPTTNSVSGPQTFN